MRLSLRPGALLLPVAVFYGFFLFGGTDASAQIQVSLELPKKDFLQHEGIVGTLTIVNRAGRDVVLAGYGGKSWLDFEIFDGSGNQLAPSRASGGPGPVALKSGQPYRVQVVVNQQYSMVNEGFYRVKAMVYFPPLKQSYPSNTLPIQVEDGREYWQQVVGVPPGEPGAGTYRQYQLIYFDAGRERQLYFRLKDQDTGIVKTAYSLGRVLTSFEPQKAVDGRNRLHVLHQGAPKVYSYAIINVDGTVHKHEIYHDDDAPGRPQLSSLGQAEVGVTGGVTDADQKTRYEDKSFRRLSERPPGMPDLKL